VLSRKLYAGFNPAWREDLELFNALLDGDHLARGFRSSDIRQPLFGSPKSAPLQRRDSAAVGRILKRLHVRHLVAKISRTRRWRVTQLGHRLLKLAIQIYHRFWPQLAA
jgi:hypothetical protein